MDENIALQLQQALGEAGGVAWCELYGHKEVDGQQVVVKINLTARELNASLALESLINALGVAKEKYNMVPYNVTKRVPAPVDPFPVEPLPFKEPTYEPVDGIQYMAISKIKVVPGTDGKTQVDMYAEGHQYPDLKVKLTPAQLAGMFKATGDWKPDHFEKVGEYGVNWSVSWKNSTNLNKNGKPYKNVVAVEQG
jgi:hypothetical protein